MVAFSYEDGQRLHPVILDRGKRARSLNWRLVGALAANVVAWALIAALVVALN